MPFLCFLLCGVASTNRLRGNATRKTCTQPKEGNDAPIKAAVKPSFSHRRTLLIVLGGEQEDNACIKLKYGNIK